MFLTCVENKKFKVYQIDVKSIFLNDELGEEIHIEKIEGFPLIEENNMICGLKKTLYGEKKTLRAWNARLDKYLTKLGFSKDMTVRNLYLK